MFKLKKEKGIYYLTYLPKKCMFVSPTLESCINQVVVLQSLEKGNLEYALKNTIGGPRALGKTLQIARYMLCPTI